MFSGKHPFPRRVRKWSLNLNELLKDTAGEREFYKFLEAEFSEENLKFKLACDELRKCKQSEIETKQKLIYELLSHSFVGLFFKFDCCVFEGTSSKRTPRYRST